MEKINTALILCAGYGKRLNPLTLNTPKPLLKVKDISLLENTINLINDLGIKNILINTFYLKQQIKEFINNKNFNCKIHFLIVKFYLGFGLPVQTLAEPPLSSFPSVIAQ